MTLASAPSHWTRGRIKNMIRSASNGVWGDDPSSDKNAGVYCIRAADFERASQRVSSRRLPMRSVDKQTFLKHKLNMGDIILEKSGGGEKQPVGMAVLFDLDIPAVCSNFCAKIVPASWMDSRFLTYALATAYNQGLTQNAIKQTTGIQNLDTGTFFSSPWAYPGTVEQQRIADFLDTETAHIDRLIAAQQTVETVLMERREASVIAAVTGAHYDSRRPSELAWVDNLPEEWQEVRLGLLAKMGSGHTPSRSHPEWWMDTSIPWITTGEVQQVRNDRLEVITETREKISHIGLANSAAELHPAGTVVLCRTASAGYSAVMGTDMATSQDFVTWTCGPRLDPFYLLWCLRAMRQDLLGRLAMGSTHKTIYVPDLQMLRIPLPPIEKQREIVEGIRTQNHRTDRLVDAVRKQRALLRERRQALITAAVTGEFDVSTVSGRGIDVS